MVLKRLPLDVQSIFSASAQIKTISTAVEELVYNALDANSTSIAIKVNIQDNYIQVVDNGHGVNKDDFPILGQRYTTSRYDDSLASKSIQKYGHSGQSLANIIKISQNVKITSRWQGSEETWFKLFCNGKVNKCTSTQARPSVGTTVEIEGFLFNLTIQKKAIIALQELQKIKTFLQQMSLVHCNTSFSLRDNSENDIIFKINKNRDIYQTLSLLLGIEKSSLQELQVEKNQYKVTGFIQKQDSDSHGFQWIFVNKKFIENSNLHKTVNHNIVKKNSQKKFIKTKNQNNEEMSPKNNKVPDYFLFIICEHKDYDILFNPKHTLLEFKNCNQVNKLLEKLIKFYNGDICLSKKTTEKSVEEDKSNGNDKNTRNEVKMIMEKILGSYYKKNNGSQLHNGVKGKIIKRKTNKKVKNNSKDDKNKITRALKSVTPLAEQNENPVTKIKRVKNGDDNEIKDNGCAFKIPKKIQTRNNLTSINPNKEHNVLKEMNPQKTKHEVVNKDPLISKFEKETGEVQKRCQILSKKVDNWFGFKKKRKCKVFTNEYVQYSIVTRDSKKMTIRKKIDEVIIHEYLPLPQKTKTTKYDCNNVMRSDDLLRPVAVTYERCNVQGNDLRANILKQKADDYNGLWSKPCDLKMPRLTYESHCYTKDAKVRDASHEVLEDVIDNDRRFISHVSRDNCLSSKKRKKETGDEHFSISIKKHTVAKKPNFLKSQYQADELQSLYSRQFTEWGSIVHETSNITLIPSGITPAYNTCTIGSTYTIIDSDKSKINDAAPKINIENAHNSCYFPDTYSMEVLHDSSENCIDQSMHHNNALVKKPTPNKREVFPAKAQKRNYNSEQYVKYRDLLEVDETPKICETYCIQATLSYDNKYYTEQTPEMENNQNSLNRNISSFQGANNLDVIFISNSQQSNTEISKMNIQADIDPLRICETIFDDHDNEENGKYNFIFNSVNDFTNEHNNNGKLSDLCEIAHYSKQQDNDHILNGGKQDFNEEINLDCNAIELNNFNLKNRRRFVPKGMSPIFENCNTRGTCNYEFGEDYYEETVYNNFIEDVQINTEVFEPKIQDVKELTTRDVERINNKLNKDNACLTFNSDSLNQIKVLGQVDYKFIATKIKGKSKGQCDYLVLFDQHAVDERIRLEKNMSEYFDGDQWKRVTLDGVSLKLTRDEILYLHNNKKKFHKLGLEWNILDKTDISVTSIPEAILGKNARRVETVLKAVKNLIKEVINMIKEQGGCVSLYPKSIMDLVFSEACRYAIMFGDALSKADCIGLLDALSECKTPFQCAHGRPVMAVLMDITSQRHEYKIDFKGIQRFRKVQNLNK